MSRVYGKATSFSNHKKQKKNTRVIHTHTSSYKKLTQTLWRGTSLARSQPIDEVVRVNDACSRVPGRGELLVPEELMPLWYLDLSPFKVINHTLVPVMLLALRLPCLPHPPVECLLQLKQSALIQAGEGRRILHVGCLLLRLMLLASQ